MVKRRNRKSMTVIDFSKSSADKGVQYYRTTLSNSLGYTDGFATSIWPLGSSQKATHGVNEPVSGNFCIGQTPGCEWHNTGSSEGYDFGELNKINYDSLIELYGPVENSCNISPSSSYLHADTIFVDPSPDQIFPVAPFTASGITIFDRASCIATSGVWATQEAIHSASCAFPGAPVACASFPTTGWYEGAYWDSSSAAILPENQCGHFEFEVSGAIITKHPTLLNGFQNDITWTNRIFLWPSDTAYGAPDPALFDEGTKINWNTITDPNQPSGTFCLMIGNDPQQIGAATGGGIAGYSVFISGTAGGLGGAFFDEPTYQSPDSSLSFAPVQSGYAPLQQKWRIKRTYNPPPLSGNLCPWEMQFQVSENEGCWTTFFSASIDSLTKYLPGYSVSTMTQMLSQSYYLLADWDAATLGVGPARHPTTSSIASASLTVLSHSGGRSEYSLNPTASISYLYPAGFTTNDSPIGQIFNGSAQLPYGGAVANSNYKDYGIQYHTPYYRNTITQMLEQRGHGDQRGLGVGERLPFFNSYDDFAQDIRVMAPEYTILPEFKISDHMEFYKDTQWDWFGTDQPKDVFDLPGGNITSSLLKTIAPPVVQETLNLDFFREYSNSDFLSDFDLLVYQHEESRTAPIATPGSMSLTCKVVKKLLPYEGFYPMLRTTQLASLFDKALDYKNSAGGENLKLYHYNNTEGCWRAATDGDYFNHPEWTGIRKQGIVTPFFAPGILYNSIKSGLAVSWTIVTGSNLHDTYFWYNTGRITGSECCYDPDEFPDCMPNWKKPGNCPEDFLNTVVYNDPAYARRIPFESLYTLQGIPTFNPAATNPEDGAFHINYPETLMGYFTSSICTSSAPKDLVTLNQNFRLSIESAVKPDASLYLLAMNNFLASTVGIFISSKPHPLFPQRKSDRGNLTSFVSLTVGEILSKNHGSGIGSGNYYFMDVELERTPWQSPGGEVFMIGSAWDGAKDNHFYENDFLARNINAFSYNVADETYGCPPGNPNPQYDFSTYEFGAEDISLFTGLPVVYDPLGGYIYNFGTTFNGRYFGPSTRKWKSHWDWINAASGAHYNVADPAQAPYTPPHFYGKSIAHIRYDAGAEWETNTATNENPFLVMVNNMEIEYSNPELLDRIKEGGGNFVWSGGEYGDPPETDTFSENSFCYKMAQHVSDSVDLKGITGILKKVRDEFGRLVSIENVYEADQTRYVISSKFESPVYRFIFDAPSYSVAGGLHPTCSFSSSGFMDGLNIGTGMGLWERHGITGKQLREVSENPVGTPAPYDIPIDPLVMRLTVPPGVEGGEHDLIQALGIRAAEQANPGLEKPLGQGASSRVLKEAIVAIPFVDNHIPSNSEYAETIPGNYSAPLIRLLNEGRDVNLFKIDRPVMVANWNKLPEERPRTEMMAMIPKMQSFVLPPMMDFLYDSSANPCPPFVMYIFPFETVLEKSDLQDIWQNSRPRIAEVAEKDTFTINQSLGGGVFWELSDTEREWGLQPGQQPQHSWTGRDEFFHGKRLPVNIRWFVFKIKQRGFTNYTDITPSQVDDFDAVPFVFSPSPPGTSRADPAGGHVQFSEAVMPTNWYSYNWPYDFCSLIELGKMEAGFNFGKGRRANLPGVEPLGSILSQPPGGDDFGNSGI